MERLLLPTRRSRIKFWVLLGLLAASLLFSTISHLRVGSVADGLKKDRTEACHREDVIRADIRHVSGLLRDVLIVVVRAAPPVEQMDFERRQQHELFKSAVRDLAAANERLERLSCGTPNKEPS